MPDFQEYHASRGVRDAKVLRHRLSRDPHNPVAAVHHQRDRIPLAPGDLAIDQEILQFPHARRPERPEAIEGGCARLAGTRRASIVKQIEDLWDDGEAYGAMARAGNPFGDGRASDRIVDLLQGALEGGERRREAV